ncbi:MAG: methionyl-tRNA formyltransferase [Bacteroidaceae bacterium]|nr:methionyl-tRNA formyltransferase [Bacteroidaceae bacterium]MBP5523783.1 methionyl-tRNA formyltransferase [Bacteroidaceae bacterium]
MTKETLRIVYMGTPDFAVESLRALVEGGYNVVAVVTMPDKPMGRHGSVLQPSPVKQYATEHGLKVMQPEKLKDPEFVEELRGLNADLQVVVAFRMLPEVVWSMPRFGTINAHASLLPKYRGAAPINWAVINGETETGVTTFLLKHEIDTGDIIDQVRIPIAESDNVEVVHDRLMALSGELVVKTVDSIIDGTFKTTPQDDIKDVEPTPAPKIFRDTCRIDWNQSTKRIYDFVRGLSPYPAAWTMLAGKSVKIYEVSKNNQNNQDKPGTITSDGKTYLRVQTADGTLDILTLQLEGKKKMPVEDLLRGMQLPENAFFC